MRGTASVACVLLCLALVPVPVRGQDSGIPGQILDVRCTAARVVLSAGGTWLFHLSGDVKVIGDDLASMKTITVFVGDLSTRVTPEGRWALLVPLESTSFRVTVTAWQDGFCLGCKADVDARELAYGKETSDA